MLLCLCLVTDKKYLVTVIFQKARVFYVKGNGREFWIFYSRRFTTVRNYCWQQWTQICSWFQDRQSLCCRKHWLSWTDGQWVNWTTLWYSVDKSYHLYYNRLLMSLCYYWNFIRLHLFLAFHWFVCFYISHCLSDNSKIWFGFLWKLSTLDSRKKNRTKWILKDVMVRFLVGLCTFKFWQKAIGLYC